MPGSRWYEPRRLAPGNREFVVDTRLQRRQWSSRRLWKEPPLPGTRSNCARVPTAAWKSAISTTSHSPGGRLSRNDEPAGRVPVSLSKRSLNLLWFTGLPPSGWEAGEHVLIKDLARSLRRGQPSSSRATPFLARPGVFPLPSHTVHRHPISSISIRIISHLSRFRTLTQPIPTRYHRCCFYSFGKVEEEVVRGPHRTGSGPAMRSRSPEEERAGPGALPGRRGGDSGAGPQRVIKGSQPTQCMTLGLARDSTPSIPGRGDSPPHHPRRSLLPLPETSSLALTLACPGQPLPWAR